MLADLFVILNEGCALENLLIQAQNQHRIVFRIAFYVLHRNQEISGIQDGFDIKKQISCGDPGSPDFGSLEFDELVQLIMENDCVYSFLIYYFIDWISDQAFEDYAAKEMKKGKSLRQVHAE